MLGSSQSGFSLQSILTAIQNAVSGVNNLGQILSQATINSSSLQVVITSTIFSTTTGTVTTVNTSIGLTGGPITTTGTIAVSLSKLTNSLASDNAISSAVYTDGPTVAQGTSGVWFGSGTVTVQDSAGAATIGIKIWDGTTVFGSGRFVTTGSNLPMTSAMSGFLTNPSSNIRISCTSNTSTSRFIANNSGNGKDSTITAIRIG